MPLTQEQIIKLLKSYAEGTATPAEEQQLFEWAATTQDDSLIKSQIKTLLHHHEDVQEKVDWERIYEEILEKTKKSTTPPPQRKGIWYKVAAAILILLMSGSAIYYFNSKDSLTQSQEQVAKNTALPTSSIHPGSTKAVLQAGNNRVLLSKTDTSFILAGNKVKINNGAVNIEEQTPVKYTLKVPRGGTYSLVLADGTKVWLNASSQLEYPSQFSGAMREVKLSGEAYFEVATNAQHPFIVHTKQQDIKVLGTSFNVQAYPDNETSATTLIDGKVVVHKGKEQWLLAPGQQLETNRLGAAALNKNVNMSEIIAWKKGYFRFDKANIQTIMKRLSRWYNIDVEYIGAIPEQYFGAIMNREKNISSILKLLEATGEVHFEVEGNTVIVSR